MEVPSQRASSSGEAHVNLDSISLRCATHVTFRKEAIWEQ